jgi:hypothetical protein
LSRFSASVTPDHFTGEFVTTTHCRYEGQNRVYRALFAGRGVLIWAVSVIACWPSQSNPASTAIGGTPLATCSWPIRHRTAS